MKSKSPFHSFQPCFCSGVFDDPLLLIRNRSKNSNILVDCGQINHLAKRVLKSISSVFITHAHMDHFIGIDWFTRSVLVSGKTINLIGPEGIAEKMESKLKGYQWNLTEAYYCNFNILEVTKDHIYRYLLDGMKGFQLFFKEEIRRENKIVFENELISVEADICDHKIPVLIFKFTEKPVFRVDESKLEALSIDKGPWLNRLKEWFYFQRNDSGNSTSDLFNMENLPFESPFYLYEAIKRVERPNVIGYITDVGFTDENVSIITNLMENIDLLVCECTYLRDQVAKARESYHLSTLDVNQLLSMIKPRYFLPMHLSKSYLSNHLELYHQLILPNNCRLIKSPTRITLQPVFPEPILF